MDTEYTGVTVDVTVAFTSEEPAEKTREFPNADKFSISDSADGERLLIMEDEAVVAIFPRGSYRSVWYSDSTQAV
jgi:hypothetical protein